VSVPAIEAQSLSFSAEGRIILDSLDVRIQQGELLGLVGGSGSGKSTLIKCLAGLLTPDSGSVRIFGQDLTGVPEHRAEELRGDIGFVFQYSALFDSLTVFENIALAPIRRRGYSRQRARDLVRQKLAQVQLEGVEDYLPGELSGGMAKRVGLARALAMEPKILFYDEPTSGLDPPTAASIHQLICATRRNLGVTSVVVSHDVPALLQIADRIGMLEAGRIVFCGTPEEFLSSPDPRVARFAHPSEPQESGQPEG
jgi:phospholipid/cholesterol/gamma-HCH transport system ATP-binding protein